MIYKEKYNRERETLQGGKSKEEYLDCNKASNNPKHSPWNMCLYERLHQMIFSFLKGIIARLSIRTKEKVQKPCFMWDFLSFFAFIHYSITMITAPTKL